MTIVYVIFMLHRTSHVYDAVEMHSRSTLESQSIVYDNPSVGNYSKDVKMQENPAYQTTS